MKQGRSSYYGFEYLCTRNVRQKINACINTVNGDKTLPCAHQSLQYLSVCFPEPQHDGGLRKQPRLAPIVIIC